MLFKNTMNNISEEIKRLITNFLSLSVLQGANYILPLITLPYLVKVLGVEKFGLVAFAQAFISFFGILVDYGFNLSATREVSIYRDNKIKLTEIYCSVMIIKLFLIFVSFLILTIIIFCCETFLTNWKLYYLTFLFVIGQALFPVWYFQGLEKMKYITIVNITSKLIFTILIFIFIKVESDYILVPILNGFGFILGGVFSISIVSKIFKQEFKIQSLNIIVKYFKDSSQFFLSRVSVTVYTSANAFVLGLFTNTTMVGYYSIAEKLYQAILGVYKPVVQVLYPYVAKERDLKLFKKIFLFVVIINTMGIILLYFLGEDIFNLFFTQNIGIESIRVFNIFLVVSLIVVPSILLGYPFLGALGFAKYPNYSVVYASVFHIFGLLILMFVRQVNIYTVSMMVIFTQAIDLIYRSYGVYKEKLWKYE